MDIVFPSAKVAVDVRGCFWHACPIHGTWPRSNADWWATKLQGNRERDTDTVRRLLGEGWVVVVVWEHDDIQAQADIVEKLVRSRTP